MDDVRKKDLRLINQMKQAHEKYYDIRFRKNDEYNKKQIMTKKPDIPHFP